MPTLGTPRYHTRQYTYAEHKADIGSLCLNVIVKCFSVPYFKLDCLSSQKSDFSYFDANLANFVVVHIVTPNMKVDSRQEYPQDFSQKYFQSR